MPKNLIIIYMQLFANDSPIIVIILKFVAIYAIVYDGKRSFTIHILPGIFSARKSFCNQFMEKRP